MTSLTSKKRWRLNRRIGSRYECSTRAGSHALEHLTTDRLSVKTVVKEELFDRFNELRNDHGACKDIRITPGERTDGTRDHDRLS